MPLAELVAAGTHSRKNQPPRAETCEGQQHQAKLPTEMRMNMFDRWAKRGRSAVSRPLRADPHISPVNVVLDDGLPGSLRIDRAIRLGDWRIVAGWSTGAIELAIRAADGGVAGTAFATPRLDVAAHLGVACGDGLGFVLVAPAKQGEAELLCGKAGRQVVHAIRTEPTALLDANALALMMPALGWLASRRTPFSQEWIDLVKAIPVGDAPSPVMRGMLEYAAANGGVRAGLASGWLSAPESAIVWLQDAEGGVHGLDRAFRMDREDVCTALALDMPVPLQHQPGFCVWIDGLTPGTTLDLKALHGNVIHQLAQALVVALPSDPVEAARQLFSAPADARLAERIAIMEMPVLDALIVADRHRWKTVPVRVHEVGSPMSEPRVSIIVPLYGRADFVEHHFIEFDRDPWLKRNADIIYVVDDRALIERFTTDAHMLHRLYGIPFRWIWGGANRGFAGASNLGASIATAPVLLFMNSDVFPQAPGWLPPLLDVLEQQRDIGIVAPRLVFADGSIQHAGMQFVRREELGIWINHHPFMGLDPSLDPHAHLSIVPAVTGACVAIRREDFERVAGWDDGYLIGDFEDSDLCLKLRREGLKSAYLPQVQLTHLERQSFRLLDQGPFRSQVLMYNALRHQHRWQDELEHVALESESGVVGPGVAA